MPHSFRQIDAQAKTATALHHRRRSTMALENAVELALTDMSVGEVIKVLCSQIDYLKEFCTMELDERFLSLGPRPEEKSFLAHRKEGLEKFLKVNHLTNFQREVVEVILDPDTGPVELAWLLDKMAHHIAYLESIQWKPMRQQGDMVHRPNHYTRFPLEPTHFAMEYGLNWCEGNTLKYICRFPFKNGIEDIRKAMRYVEMFIKFLDGDPNWSK